MGDRGDDLKRLRATANLHRAKFEISLFVQCDVKLYTPIIATDIQHMDCGSGAFANRDVQLMDGTAVLNDRPRKGSTRRHDDAFGRWQWPSLR